MSLHLPFWVAAGATVPAVTVLAAGRRSPGHLDAPAHGEAESPAPATADA